MTRTPKLARDLAISAYGQASSSPPTPVPILRNIAQQQRGVQITRNVAELKPQQQREFQITFGAGDRVMQAPCRVSRPYESMVSEGHGPFNALWDTGSSCCVITRRLAEACGLRATGTVRELIVMQGHVPSQTYLADLILPGGITFMNVEMLEGISLPDIDVIVGLDVIRCGDLSLKSSGGSSVFSFRTPSGRVAFHRQRPGKSPAPDLIAAKASA